MVVGVLGSVLKGDALDLFFDRRGNAPLARGGGRPYVFLQASSIRGGFRVVKGAASRYSGEPLL